MSVPAGATVADVRAALLRGADTGRLPAGYEVEWRWRNAENRPLYSGDFEQVWADSARGGFRGLMRRRIESAFRGR